MKGETLMELTNLNLVTQLNDEASLKKREEDIMQMGNQLSKLKRTKELRQLIEKVRPFLESLGKAKASKLIRDLLDLCLVIDDANGDIKVDLCNECITWAQEQNIIFLRRTLQARLVRLLNDLGRYSQSLQQALILIRELKKVDDKDLIVEVQLEESKSYYNLSNLTKARAALTSARTTANSMYVPPEMQASLDMQSGILHAADERDFKTASSYFFEAFESYDSVNNEKKALQSLKYLLLSKIMLNTPEEVYSILAHKLAAKYSSSDIDAMRAIADASKRRSLADFNKAFGNYKVELQCDFVVKKHFSTLSDNMLEKDLCRIIEPYSCVEIKHIASTIDLSVDVVERKLGQMLLDKKIFGCLDQEEGILTVHDSETVDPAYTHALNTIHALGDVVNALSNRAKKIK